MRLKISRKEAKEAHYWLRLLGDLNGSSKSKIDELAQKAVESRNILSSIIKKRIP